MAKTRRDSASLIVDEIEAFDDDLVGTSEKVAEIPQVVAESPQIDRKQPQIEAETPVVAEAGWFPIDTALRSGLPIRISATPTGEGTLARWVRTRAFANPTHRWERTGKWEDFIHGGAVKFEARYWKPRFEAE